MLTRFFFWWALALLVFGVPQAAGVFFALALVCGLMRLFVGYQAHWL